MILMDDCSIPVLTVAAGTVNVTLARELYSIPGKVPELKPLYGSMFQDLLMHYTHWGWLDIDVILGDLAPLLHAIKHHDVATFPDGVCDE